jgi:hypothetical protein
MTKKMTYKQLKIFFEIFFSGRLCFAVYSNIANIRGISKMGNIILNGMTLDRLVNKIVTI